MMTFLHELFSYEVYSKAKGKYQISDILEYRMKIFGKNKYRMATG